MLIISKSGFLYLFLCYFYVCFSIWRARVYYAFRLAYRAFLICELDQPTQPQSCLQAPSAAASFRTGPHISRPACSPGGALAARSGSPHFPVSRCVCAPVNGSLFRTQATAAVYLSLPKSELTFDPAAPDQTGPD